MLNHWFNKVKTQLGIEGYSPVQQLGDKMPTIAVTSFTAQDGERAYQDTHNKT